jgi:drug/metabolite transporter (DMT)-like permease
MMTPGLFGGISALCLGTADFMGRFSSRAIDHHNALLGMLVAGSVALTVWVVLFAGFPSLEGLSFWWILINGIATTIMTLLLYLGLARGPVSVVAPIVTAHPVLVILYYALWHGNQLAPAQIFAIAGTVAGTIVVARYASAEDTVGADNGSLNDIKSTVVIALGSSVAYAVLIVAGQAAAEVHGQTHTLWMGRLVSLAFLLLLFGLRRRRPTIPMRWWPFLCIQGLLDVGGYIALFTGSYGPGKEVVTVVAATFGAVTVILARIILKESISMPQWLGIILIVGGVVVLSS